MATRPGGSALPKVGEDLVLAAWLVAALPQVRKDLVLADIVVDGADSTDGAQDANGNVDHHDEVVEEPQGQGDEVGVDLGPQHDGQNKVQGRKANCAYQRHKVACAARGGVGACL